MGLKLKADDDQFVFMGKRLSNPYNQRSEINHPSSLDDAFHHSLRVKRRQKEAADIFKTAAATKNMF
jgi:hypothetical protein